MPLSENGLLLIVAEPLHGMLYCDAVTLYNLKTWDHKHDFTVYKRIKVFHRAETVHRGLVEWE